MMKIIVDAMGGDHAPIEVLKDVWKRPMSIG